MEEKTNFHCIVCKSEFLSRTERNEHLETHFIHRNCKHCCRPVIVIGDLEFELHQPTYCKQIKPIHEDVFAGSYFLDEGTQENDDFEREAADIKAPNGSDIEAPGKITRNKTKINYIEETSELTISGSKVKKERPVRKAKRKFGRIPTNAGKNDERIYEKNDFNSDEDYDDIKIGKKAESEDDIIKEMDVAMKKRRKQYAKLPKTVPCKVPTCDAMFGTERTLKIHMHQVHGIKERYICPICSKECKISGNLKQHMETHSNYKRFICNYCGKGFHLPYNLKEHINMHTGAR